MSIGMTCCKDASSTRLTIKAKSAKSCTDVVVPVVVPLDTLKYKSLFISGEVGRLDKKVTANGDVHTSPVVHCILEMAFEVAHMSCTSSSPGAHQLGRNLEHVVEVPPLQLLGFFSQFVFHTSQQICQSIWLIQDVRRDRSCQLSS